MIPFPDKKYDIIYADPPWRCDCESPSRTVERFYPTMATEDILQLPVTSIARSDAMLYLWTTIAHLDVAIDVIRAWGFSYKSNIVWDKQMIGLGHWLRGQHEHLLFATKGDMKAPEKGTQPPSVLSVKRGSHSSKPFQIKRLIERYHPNTEKIELFARPLPLFVGENDGWDYWGNEVQQ